MSNNQRQQQEYMEEYLIPIYMSCTECDRYLGSVEEDYADVLGGMCIVCFKKMTEQVEVN